MRPWQRGQPEAGGVSAPIPQGRRAVVWADAGRDRKPAARCLLLLLNVHFLRRSAGEVVFCFFKYDLHIIIKFTRRNKQSGRYVSVYLSGCAAITAIHHPQRIVITPKEATCP